MSAVAKMRNFFCGMQVLDIARTRPTPTLARNLTLADLKGHGFSRATMRQQKNGLQPRRELEFCDKREAPQRLKPYPQLCVNGTAEAVPLQSTGPLNLQMLLRPLIDTVQCLLKVLNGIRGTEAQVSLAEGAKRRARQPRYSGVLEQRVGQLLRRPARLLDIGEGVKRALGQPAGESFDLIDAAYEHVPAALKLLPHLLRLTLVAAHRLDAGYLSEGGRTGGGVSREARELCRKVGPHDAITQAPAGHRIGLREATQNDGSILEAINRRDAIWLSFEEQAAVDFVAQDHDVAVANGGGNVFHIALGDDASGRILRRVQDDELGAIGDETGQLVHVEAEIALLAQWNGNSFRAQEVDHRLVNREAGIGIDDLVSLFHQREHGEEDNRFAAGNDHDFIGADLDATRTGDLCRDGLAQLRQARRRSVMGIALAQSVHSGLDDVGGRVHVGLADLKVNDVSSLALQSASTHQHFEGSFGSQP